MSSAPPILNVHTPTSSFAVVHSTAEDSLDALCDKLTKKASVEYSAARVGPGWLRYEWNDAVWNLDDDADYAIFAWRQKTAAGSGDGDAEPGPSAAPPAYSSRHHQHQHQPPAPTLFLHDPSAPLPSGAAYRNPAFYLFRRPTSPTPSAASVPKPRKSGTTTTSGARSLAPSRRSLPAGRQQAEDGGADGGVPKHKREFDKFHSENGVRTVLGSIGPVHNVRMLLKTGHRHVYVSRKFAVRHGFVPRDAAPGHYGYGGLVNIGKWPISLGPTPSADPTGRPQKSVSLSVYLSEEPHFDVILGRSFHEARGIKTDPLDPTDVRCMDNGEKVDCEVVVLRDGRGEIVTVT